MSVIMRGSAARKAGVNGVIIESLHTNTLRFYLSFIYIFLLGSNIKNICVYVSGRRNDSVGEGFYRHRYR